MSEHQLSEFEKTPVTDWVKELKAGDSQAAQKLWQRYTVRLARLASRKLGSSPKRVADEEDVALSAFHAFLNGVEANRFPRLSDRNDLWRILVMLTERKAIAVLRRNLAKKRGGGRVRGDSILATVSPGARDHGGSQQLSLREPTPEFAAIFKEELNHRLATLDDDLLRRLALGKLEGYNNRELAELHGISLRAVERKLNLIRRRWESDLP